MTTGGRGGRRKKERGEGWEEGKEEGKRGKVAFGGRGGLFWINDVWILFWVDRVGYI